MANGKEITVFGSGRTDAGVHAIGQVIHFDYPEERPLERMRFALDTQSPEDIAVRQVEIVSEDFHARYLVKEKTYQFRVDIGNHAVLFDAIMQVIFLTLLIWKKFSGHFLIY